VESVPGLTSIIIVACDSGRLLADCIASVLDSSVPVQVIVSDNASSDGSIEAIQTRWPELRLLRNGTNLGFGAACNRAAIQARGDSLLFLNPDCRVEADTVARLRAHGDARTGVLGASIIGTDGNPEPASRRRDPLMHRALMTATGLARFELRWSALAGANLPENLAASALEDVEAVSGALMFVPRVAFERIGGFDEKYFLHFEDIDLCRRSRDMGLRVACANDVRVMHAKGTSSRTRPFFVARHKHAGMWRWFVKFDPAARNPLLRSLAWSVVWMHYVVMTPLYAWRMIDLRSR
jgi:N-acetylglucosaminyl-diphospho-decaprenol L-rhamnosyltransferase